MNLNYLLFTACLSLMFVSTTQASTDWGYQGKSGPDYWAELSPEYSMCSKGMNQSPVDIDSHAAVDIKQQPIKLNYSLLVADHIKNTGHGIQVDMRSGGSITVDGEAFELQQFNFHTPSENTVNGKHFPLEAHFIHKNDAGELAVLAMMFIPGKADATLSNLWKYMPAEAGGSTRLPSSALKTIEAETQFTNYYRYNGSLTTPPCTEGIRWIIMQTPMSVSEGQIKALQAALKYPNNRPVQALNARFVVE